MACSGLTHVCTYPVQHPERLLTKVEKGGGMEISKNRTKWPVKGGAVGFQPGWFNGHSSAFMYINLGEGTVPENYSLIMQPVFQIIGPQNDIYEGSVCLPQVPLPANYTAKVGDHATIQVIELAQHGAALYNVSKHPRLHYFGTMLIDGLQCVDIEFAEPEDVPEVNATNCANSTNIGFELVFSTESLKSAAESINRPIPWLVSIPLVVVMLGALSV